MSERIFELAGAVAVELIHDGRALTRPGAHRALDEHVDVLHVEVDVDPPFVSIPAGAYWSQRD
jgi:hypothetical protein